MSMAYLFLIVLISVHLEFMWYSYRFPPLLWGAVGTLKQRKSPLSFLLLLLDITGINNGNADREYIMTHFTENK